MNAHRYQVGQRARLISGRFLDHTGGGTYEVPRLLPPADGELSYRIKNADENHERAVRESQIEPVPGQ